MHGRWVRGCKLPRTYLLGTWVNSDGHRAHCVIFSGCSRARRARESDRGCRQRAAQASACPSSWPCSSCLHLLDGAAFAVSVGVALARSDQLRALRLVLSFAIVVTIAQERGSGAGSAHRSLHERADLRLFGGSQLLQREGGRPHGAFVEVRLVAEAERRVPRVELLRALEEAGDLAVLVGVR